MRLLLLSFLLCSQAFATNAKIKDLVTIKGVRSNPLIGYGLVIGLNGTGDGGGEITNSSLKRMFQKLGLNPQQEIASNNVAAVIVTSKLPPFARTGQKLDITVSSIGNASSLAGGTLLVTPLKGGDGQVYAVSSGSLSIGGLKAGSKFATTGKIVNGGTVERELGLDFNNKKSLRLNLRNSDFTTAARIERTINRELGGKFATASDSTTIDLVVPPHYHRKVVPLISIIENFNVNVSTKAKIVINERTGTVVAGGDVLIRNIAISHGNLTIEVKNPEGDGDGKRESLHYMDKGTSLNDLVKALNGLGATPEDLMSIFQALKENGAMAGELEFI